MISLFHEHIYKCFSDIYIYIYNMAVSTTICIKSQSNVNHMVYFELGRTPLYINSYIRMICYWLIDFILFFLCLTPLSAIFQLYHGDQI